MDEKQSMTTYKITIPCFMDETDRLSNALEPHMDTVCIMLNLEDETEQSWRIEAYTRTKPTKEDVCGYFTTPPLYEKDMIIEKVEDINWLEHVYKSFPPKVIGSFYVYGNHIDNPEPPKDTHPLEITAATAFGSGEHETTHGCLEALSDLAKKQHGFERMLDMGCGSGILGIGAMKLWDAPALFVDCDDESVQVCSDNIQLNHISSKKYRVLQSFGFQKLENEKPFDLICANILANPLLEMAECFKKYLAKDGVLIISGLLDRHTDAMMDAYRPLVLVDKKNINNWMTLVFQSI
jgi:ribosomal protein L11 methyltransferase